MGSFHTKSTSSSSPSDKVVEGLKHKIRVLQGEISEIMCMRENENQIYQQEMMVFALKEAKWKRERKRLKEEVKKLKKKLEEREEILKGIENHEMVMGEKCEKSCQIQGTSMLLEHIREEQARRDEAIEKWKQLYFAIKVELDDLIQRTDQGDRLCWKAEEEELLEELHKELKAKEDNIELLKAKLASLEQQESKRQRDVDILRQSLRIMTHKKKPARGLSRSLHL